MIVARFTESRYLVRDSEVFIKNKTKIASWVSSNQWAGINSGKLLWEADKRNSVLEELSVKKLAVIQEDIFWRESCRWVMLKSKTDG